MVLPQTQPSASGSPSGRKELAIHSFLLPPPSSSSLLPPTSALTLSPRLGPALPASAVARFLDILPCRADPERRLERELTPDTKMQPAVDIVVQHESGQICLTTVLKLVNNIISNQDEPKFRRIRTSNATIQSKILDVWGGTELLQAIGFAPQQEELVLPTNSSMVKLIQARQMIDAALSKPQTAATAVVNMDTDVPTAAERAPSDLDEADSEFQAALAMSVSSGASAAGHEEDDPDLKAALAMSVSADAASAEHQGDDEDLSEALAMSLEHGPAPDACTQPHAPTGAPSAHSLTAKERLTQRVQQLFAELSSAGVTPNEAAAQA